MENVLMKRISLLIFLIAALCAGLCSCEGGDSDDEGPVWIDDLDALTPKLLEPEDNVVINIAENPCIVFRWTKVEGAENYWMPISLNGTDFDSPLFQRGDIDTLDSLTWEDLGSLRYNTPQGIDPNEPLTLYWQVKPMGVWIPEGENCDSKVRKLTITGIMEPRHYPLPNKDLLGTWNLRKRVHEISESFLFYVYQKESFSSITFKENGTFEGNIEELDTFAIGNTTQDKKWYVTWTDNEGYSLVIHQNGRKFLYPYTDDNELVFGIGSQEYDDWVRIYYTKEEVKVKPMPEKIIPFTTGKLSSLSVDDYNAASWDLILTERCTLDEQNNPVWEVYEWFNSTHTISFDGRGNYHKFFMDTEEYEEGKWSVQNKVMTLSPKGGISSSYIIESINDTSSDYREHTFSISSFFTGENGEKCFERNTYQRYI